MLSRAFVAAGCVLLILVFIEAWVNAGLQFAAVTTIAGLLMTGFLSLSVWAAGKIWRLPNGCKSIRSK